MRRPVCLAVEWVAWAVWTINPTLNRNDEGPGFFRAFLSCAAATEIRALKRALALCGDYSVVGVVRHFPRTVDVPAGSTKS